MHPLAPDDACQRRYGRRHDGSIRGDVTDGRADDARKVIASERMTWPNVLRGGDAIAERYHVAWNPSYFVVDADGLIRSRGSISPDSLDRLVEQLVGEAEAQGKN